MREPYYDVNNDTLCTAQDALYVINYINSLAQGEGEAGGVAARSPAIPWEPAVARPVASAVSSAASPAALVTPQAPKPAPAERPIPASAGPEAMRSTSGSAQDRLFRQVAVSSGDLEDLLDEIAGDIDAVWQPRG
jgi:hypothetical protein